MGFSRLFVLLLVISVVSSVWSHHHQHAEHSENSKLKDRAEHPKKFGHRDEDINAVHHSEVTESNKKGLNVDLAKGKVPFSARRLEKMLEKAILQIITGDLNTADMLLLKSLNYSVEEVQAIRERELTRRKDEELAREESKKSRTKAFYESTTEKKKKHRERNSMDVDYSTNPSYDKKLKKKDRNEKDYGKDFDYESYNRQAVLDYENLASKFDSQQFRSAGVLDYEENDRELKGKESNENFHRDFDKAMEPHVVFKIRYDDSEFDSSSGSDENGKERNISKASKQQQHHVPSSLSHAGSKNAGSFHASSFTTSSSPSSSSSSSVHTPLPIVYQLASSSNQPKLNYPRNQIYPITSEPPLTKASSTQAPIAPQTVEVTIDRENLNSQLGEEKHEFEKTIGKKLSEYEGLEWIEDDVYRVLPAFADSLGYENNEENETSDYEDASNYSQQNAHGFPEGENDTLEYQNDANDSVRLVMANTNASADNLTLSNLSAYQQLAIAHRREGNLTASFDSQGQKAIEDIKSRVLALTRRFNLSANANQVQREKLTMFSPTCQIPRNTDPDAWADPFSMNMHFQLNLTSSEHVVAAKLRIFKLPQENLTAPSASTFDEEEEDEKKIRISIYYYTKSLKKHRSKKRLMDSVVTPLSAEGTHLALDVRQGLRFWRLNPRNSHGNGSNHGLVIQIEDQDGRPLKPALYIQQPSCGEQDSDQKAYQRIPALFVRACSRYVRVVNGERVTYVNCRH